MARTMMHYAAERKYFTAGIMIVDLKSVNNTLAMLKLIKDSMIKHLDLAALDAKGQQQITSQN